MISENLNIVKEKITRICKNVGRNPDEIKIIAVSKNTGITSIQEVIKVGIKDLGENKAQEFAEKFPLVADNIDWHFIGHLQRNKVKFVVGKAAYIHSVDSLRLSEEINNQAQKLKCIQKILLEIKTSEEEEKYGIRNISEIFDSVAYAQNAQYLNLVGLMTMAPFTEDEKNIRKCFSDLRKLKTILNEKGFKIPELSMGMTNDFEIAIQEGSTMIRLGTAIFGERNYSKSWKEQ
ncbi:MAG: YggS family pyridoxal phosphate-dependent enzyme [Ignavibacteriales bacterium]|nr:YggS family pyridoxal phosphate-dependent enzyme [Ignavibacteriales bacterium]